MSLFRGFIAIDITATSELLRFEKEIRNTGADVKLVEPINIHITLKFLGDTDETSIDAIEQSMKESVKDIKPFPITLRGTGVFPNKNYIKVLWIGIIDPGAIETIAHAIDNSLSLLGFHKEKRGFSPHLTIGRVKTARNKQQLLGVVERYSKEEFAVHQVQSIVLKKSELTPKGPIYTTVREVFL
ncbi:MAG: 2'-5' RNA ligase [Thermoplasmata archaeon M11B2D]|nr:MAG: 2'-5' RNA ligase [Thermoplasmata archaeon M11B2D]PNX52960.1 MAG: 2'-5' RNA ligase [Thermoplasmata archaeon M9B2D]